MSGAEDIPSVLGRHGFVSESELGQGTWGTVIKACKMASNSFPKIPIEQVVAIKCVRSDYWAKAPRADGDWKLIKATDEIKALRLLMSTEAQDVADPSRMQTVLDRLQNVRNAAGDEMELLLSLLLKFEHAAEVEPQEIKTLVELFGGDPGDAKSTMALLRLFRKAHVCVLDPHEITTFLNKLRSFAAEHTDDIATQQLVNALLEQDEQPVASAPLSPDAGCLARLLGDFSDGGWSCLVLEYCSGGDLSNKLVRNHFVVKNEVAVRQLTKPIIQGMLFMEKKGVMHRDLKPANILLRKKWNPTEGDTAPDVCLADFGTSTMKNQLIFHTNVGTPSYMSPERLAHDVYDFEAESWAAGIVMFELFFGRLPFADNEKMETIELHKCHQKFKDPKAIFQHVKESTHDMSVPLMDLLGGMLHPDPLERLSLAEVASHEWWWWYEAEHEAAASPWQKEKKLVCFLEQAKALLELCKEFPDHAAALCALAVTVLVAGSRSWRWVYQVDATAEKVRAMGDEIEQLQVEVATIRSNAADTAPIDSASIWSGVAAVVREIHGRCVSSGSSNWTTALGESAVHASTALLWHLMDVSLEERLERLEVGRLRLTMQRRVFVERNIWVLMMMAMWMCLQ